MPADFDALLVLSFGGPDGPEDVLPFLDNVLRGRNVPRARMLEVAEHYQHFGGVSPINAQNRALIAALEVELAGQGIKLPIYWGNRNWHPLLPDTLRQMRDDGVQRALVYVTSAYSSYSGCRQYLEDLAGAAAQVGAGCPALEKIRPFFNHPGFVEVNTERVSAALEQIPQPRRDAAHVLYTAHSLPLVMAQKCDYEQQLRDVADQIAARLELRHTHLVYQSRSGPPSQPWLEPDVLDVLRQLHAQQVTDVVIAPIGFTSDHMEVLYDLDTEARQLCEQLGIHMIRAATAGTHTRFIQMIRELIEERLQDAPRLAVGGLEPRPHRCVDGCCPSGRS